MSLADLDLWAFHAINGIAGRSALLDRLVGGLDMTTLKSMAIVAIFGMLWHVPSQDMRRQREVLLVLFVALAVALLLNRTVSFMLPFRARPMYTSGIGYISPAAEHHADLEHWSSFPSDNATLLFAVATSFWLLSRAWGLWFGAFSAVVLVARIYMGVHFPSDVLVGAGLGVATTIAFNRDRVRASLARPALVVEKRAPALFYGLLFAALFEMSSMFWLTRKVGRAIFHHVAG